MEKYAQIAVVEKGVVFSDPWYGENVWCQYRKAFHDTDWLLKLETKSEEGYLSFNMTLGRPTVLAGLKFEPAEVGYVVQYPSRYDLQTVELGMDTAKIFLGLKEQWDLAVGMRESASIGTGTDGLFGDLQVFTCKGEDAPAGFFLSAGLDEIFMDEEELFQYFLSSFNAKEMEPEMFARRTDPKSIAVKMLASAESKHALDAVAKQKKAPDKEPER